MNTLVEPTQPVVDWRTRFSGITSTDMDLARASSQTLRGWTEARSKLFELVDNATVLVGHALQHDLKALHMMHDQIVDTAIVTRQAITPTTKRCWALRTLCSELLGREIQTRGSKGHDCLEDTFAAREILLFCLRERQKLEQWASGKRIEISQKSKIPRHTTKSQKSSRPIVKERVEEQQRSSSRTLTATRSLDTEETLHWSDIAEDLGWPHPDTGYDPWSD